MTNYLLSYPRSGNTWVRYFVEFISQQPTSGYKNASDKAIGSKIPIGVDLSKPVIMEKSHKFYGKEYSPGDKLVVLVRDYKECMVRHAAAESWKMSLDEKAKKKFDEETKGKNEKVDYVEVLMYYDEWPGEKILIYYEDLMLHPKREIKKIVEFLDLNRKRMEVMFSNLEKHINSGIRVYHAGSQTKGKNLKYHQGRIKPGLRQYMINQMKTKHPDIYKKYLECYEK